MKINLISWVILLGVAMGVVAWALVSLTPTVQAIALDGTSYTWQFVSPADPSDPNARPPYFIINGKRYDVNQRLGSELRIASFEVHDSAVWAVVVPVGE